jgi:hypothetical protein
MSKPEAISIEAWVCLRAWNVTQGSFLATHTRFKEVSGIGGRGAASVNGKGDSGDEVGFVIGSGMDVKLSERVSLGMEGLYYAFEDDKARFFDNGNEVASINSDNDFYVVRARLTYHLD